MLEAPTSTLTKPPAMEARLADISVILQDESVQARFWTKVEKRGPDDCWPWVGGTNASRRGQFNLGGTRVYAPRISLLLNGCAPTDPADMACHTCDNPNCVNPAHLWWGSRSANMLDAAKKGRHKESKKERCKRGHLLSGDNIRRRGVNGRACRACGRITSAAYMQAIRALQSSQQDEQ